VVLNISVVKAPKFSYITSIIRSLHFTSLTCSQDICSRCLW